MNTLLKSAVGDAVTAYLDAIRSGLATSAAEDAAKASLAGAVTQVDSRWAKLAMPLSQLADDEIKHPDDHRIDLLDADARHQAPSMGWDWSLKADAQLGLEVDVLDAGQLKDLGIPEQKDHAVVAYAVTGGLGASLSGGQSVGAWSLSANAGAALSARLEWYVGAPSTTRFGQAFLDALPFFVAPMDLGSLLEAARSPDFWGCSTKIDGELAAGFSASAKWAATGWSLGLDGKKADIGLSLGVNGEASIKLGGRFRLRCTPINRGGRFGLHVQLDQLDSSEKSFGLALSAGADFSALARSAEAYLRANLPPVNAKLLDALTHPGAALSGKLQDALGRLLGDKAVKDLVPLLAGEGSSDKVAAELAAQLVAPLTDRLDELSGDIANGADLGTQLAAEFSARLFGKNPVGDKAAQAVTRFVRRALDDLKAKLEDGIEDLAGKIEGKSSAAVGKLIEPLATLGQQVGDAIGQVDGVLGKDQAVEAIRKALARYGQLRKRVMAAFADAQRARLSATLSVSLQEARSRHTVFEADFDASNDLGPAQRLFQALWSGDLRNFSHLIDSARQSGAVSNVSGWLELAATRITKESFTLSALGFDFSSTRQRKSTLDLKSDLAGNLIGVSGGGDVVAETNNRWAQRAARLGVGVRLSDAGTPQARSAIEFSGAFSAAGKTLDRELLDQIQRSLSVMTGQAGPIDLGRLLGTPQADDTEFKKVWQGLSFLLPMSLQADEFSSACARSDDLIRRTLLASALAAMDSSLQGGEAFPFNRPSALVRGIAQDLEDGSGDEQVLRYLERYPRHHASTSALAERSERLGFGTVVSSGSGAAHSLELKQMRQIHRLSRAVLDMVDFLRACRALNSELMAASTASSEAVFDRCFRHLRDATEALDIFAVASETLVGNDEAVAWPLVAFCWTLCRLARGEGGATFTPMIVRADRPGQPIPLLA